MATEQIEQQIELTDREQFALTDVYSNAGVMLRALAAMRQNWSTRIPQVKAFQESWNANLEVLRAWAGQGATGPVAQILTNGLVPDGRYGAMTATAIGELIYLISEDYDDAANSVPVAASSIPTWYAQYHSLIEGALTTNFALMSTSNTSDVSINENEIAQNTLDDSGGTAELPNDMGSDITFDEPTTIVSTAKREGWNVPIWAIGLGLVTASGLIYLVAKKTRRRGSAAA